MVNNLPTPQRLQNIWRSRRFRFITSAGAIVTVLVILGALVYRQRAVLLNYPWHIRPEILVLSFVVFSIDIILVAWIWGSILNTMGKTLPFHKHLCYYAVANVAKRLPGTVWYIAGRGQFYHTENISLSMTSAASGVEFVVALLTSILISLFFTLKTLLAYSQWSLVILAAIFLLGLSLLHPKVFGWLLQRFKVQSEPLQASQVFQWLVGYGLAWMLSGLVIYLLGSSMMALPLSALPYIIGCVALLNILTSATFFAPTNMGLGEIGLSFLLSSIIPLSVAIVLTITARIALTLYEIAWAAICAIWLSWLSKQANH